MTIIYTTIVGIISALLWGTAFGAMVQKSITIGLIAGIILGLIMSLFAKMARAGGSVNSGETNFVNHSLVTLIAALAIGSGVLVWVIKFIF